MTSPSWAAWAVNTLFPGITCLFRWCTGRLSQRKGRIRLTGKEKCRLLRKIRRQLAERNGIDYPHTECDYSGDCAGTCPVCDGELAALEKELLEKQDPVIPLCSEESLRFRSEGPCCWEEDPDMFILNEVLQPEPDEPNKDRVRQKLNRAGITAIRDLLPLSPQELAALGLTEEELDALSLHLPFRGRDWQRRRRNSRHSGTLGIMLRGRHGFF